jgi:uncharacterized membrane protein
MRLQHLGILNICAALVAQIACWSYVHMALSNNTPLGTIIFTVTWNLLPYGLTMLVAYNKQALKGLNLFSTLCLGVLAFVYWDSLLRPIKSTAGISLLLWPVWHAIALVALGVLIFLAKFFSKHDGKTVNRLVDNDR